MNQGLSREQAEEEAKKALAHVGVKEENFTKSPSSFQEARRNGLPLQVFWQ